MWKETIRTRFAPTPSGFLHLGNVFSFLLTWLIARKNQGKILLRIDDLDSVRTQKTYLEDIFKTLDWLKLDYDEGAQSVGDFLQHHSQTLYDEQYQLLLQYLKNLPDTLYTCACSRVQMHTFSNLRLSQHPCRVLTNWEEKATAWRIKTPRPLCLTYSEYLKGDRTATLSDKMIDFVVRRKDGFAAYQLVSVVEDWKAHINLVVRGEDLLNSTVAQLYLASKLPENSFEKTIFFHHPLVFESSSRKMSKSKGDLSIQALRNKWTHPVRIYQMFAGWLGLPTQQIYHLQDLLEVFSSGSMPQKSVMLEDLLKLNTE